MTAHPTLHCPVIFVLTLPWCSEGSVTSSSMSSRTTVDTLPLSLFVPEVVLFTFCHLCRLSQTAQCLVSAQSWWIPADGHLPCLPVNWTYWEEERTNTGCAKAGAHCVSCLQIWISALIESQHFPSTFLKIACHYLKYFFLLFKNVPFMNKVGN